jgi:hypothetical protein
MAPLTVPAADGEINCDPVTEFNSLRAWTELNYFPSRFVTRDDKAGFGSFASQNRLSIIDAHIAATQRGSTHLHEHLAKGRYRVRAIDHVYFFVPGK